MTLKAVLEKLMQKKTLSSVECEQAMQDMLSPAANPLQTAAVLVLLRSRTETAEELSGLLAALKKNTQRVSTPHKVLDIVGTGGDGANTINISTGSAILAAACGIRVAKHGNRAVSSAAGSADVLEALGINIHSSPEQVAASIDQVGIGFCFSPDFHPGMQAMRSLRKQLNVPTIFNILGPLLNPVNPSHYLLGVYDPDLAPLLAAALQQSGTERSLVVHGCGLDELSCTGPAKVFEISKNGIEDFTLDPQQLGLSHCSRADLQGGNAEENAQILQSVFTGQKNQKNTAVAHTLILNAAAALYLYGRYPGIKNAIPEATENLYNGAAQRVLQNWIEYSND